jgi:hypothetical protein
LIQLFCGFERSATAAGLSRELGAVRTRSRRARSCSSRSRRPPVLKRFASESAERIAGNEMALIENPPKGPGAVARRQAAVHFPSDVHFKVASHRSWPRCMRLSSVSRSCAASGSTPQALLTMLYRSTHRRCRGGAPVKNLAHSASFHSKENNAPSKPGIKHLGHRDSGRFAGHLLRAAMKFKPLISSRSRLWERQSALSVSRWRRG